jgi:hypothetical protein
MEGAQLLIAHAVKLAILVVLAGLITTRRYRQCWSLTAYLLVALAGNSMTSFWPERFFNYHFYAGRQAIFDALKLLIALELSHRVFAAFPGAMSRWRAIALVVLVATTSAVALSGATDSARVAYDWQPRIVTGATWILSAIALLVAWHRLPIDSWHYAILVGYVPYLLVFTTGLNIIRKYGWSVHWATGTVQSLAYLVLMLWWAYAAWRPQESRLPPAGRAGPPLALQSMA